jgi:lipopolysaccharide transport system permease protein
VGTDSLEVSGPLGSNMKSNERFSYITPARNTAELYKFLNLLRALVMRELKGRYRRSLLGPAWAILQPLFYMVIFTFLRGVFDISSEGVPYVIFTYSALVPWTFFSNSVTRCGPSVAANAAVLKKMAISREVFPLAGVVVSLVDFAISSVILVGMMIWFHIPIGVSLLWAPLLVSLTALLALGVGLAIAAVGTYKHDILFATPFLMQFWLLATPIMYPLGRVPNRWKSLYSLNPMVGIIEGFRSALVHGIGPDFGLLMISLLGIVLVWVLAWPLFRYMSQYFADVL